MNVYQALELIEEKSKKLWKEARLARIYYASYKENGPQLVRDVIDAAIKDPFSELTKEEIAELRKVEVDDV